VFRIDVFRIDVFRNEGDTFDGGIEWRSEPYDYSAYLFRFSKHPDSEPTDIIAIQPQPVARGDLAEQWQFVRKRPGMLSCGRGTGTIRVAGVRSNNGPDDNDSGGF
jgi:hypothetical protein